MIKLFSMLFIFSLFSLSSNKDLPNATVVKANYGTLEAETIYRDCETGGLPDACCSYWTVEQESTKFYLFHVIPIDYTDWSCTTGGELKCIGCNSNDG